MTLKITEIKVLLRTLVHVLLKKRTPFLRSSQKTILKENNELHSTGPSARIYLEKVTSLEII